MRGDITIGSGELSDNTGIRVVSQLLGTVIHPKVTIFAMSGPIVIGTNCILEEGTVILNRYATIRSHCYATEDFSQKEERSNAYRGRQFI